jgi:hypothetical protein
MKDLTPLERAVMNKLLEGEDDILAALRRQLDVAKIIKRELTGVGFFLTFAIPDETRRIEGVSEAKLGDVHAEMNNLKNGASFVLYIRNGRLHMLEGYTYDEPWPSEIMGLKLRYNKDGTRDLEKVAALLRGVAQRE